MPLRGYTIPFCHLFHVGIDGNQDGIVCQRCGANRFVSRFVGQNVSMINDDVPTV